MEQKKTETIYWHPAFYAGIQIELQDDADNLKFENEHHLSKKPIRIDVLVIKKETDRPVKKNIGKIFKKHNILEYKSPDDSLTVDDFYKVYGYACFYKADVTHVNSIPLDELTITFISEKYPRELIRHLRTVRQYSVEKSEDGIYSVKGDIIPIQILVTKELSGDENLWLRSLTNKLNTHENAKKLIEDYMEHKENNLHRAVLETIMRANQKIFKEVNGMSDIFMEIVQEKFDRKLKEEVDKKVKEEVDKKVKEEVDKKVKEEVDKKVDAAKREAEKEAKKEVEAAKREAEAARTAARTTRLMERISLIQKKCAKNKPLSVIADELETEPDELRSVYDLISRYPEKTVDEICALVV